ncbi:MAG: hypothetical protein M5U08_04625 [Burkholderiales bacterium]|nr:hypothetical protein [Burkholderiales bacterium]
MSQNRVLPMLARALATAALAGVAGCSAESSGKPVAPPPRAHLVELAVVEPGRLSYAADRPGILRALRARIGRCLLPRRARSEERRRTTSSAAQAAGKRESGGRRP